MKGFLTVAGTVLIGSTQTGGQKDAAPVAPKERLNYQQMTIVTPRTAEAFGLSYPNLWTALSRATKKKLVAGCAIAVRLAPQDSKTTLALNGLVTTIELEQAALTPEKNIFIRS